jgi:hypothetical protein
VQTNPLKERSRSTQERVGKNNHHLLIYPKVKRLQNRKRFLHQCDAFFASDLRTFESIRLDVDPGYAIAMFQCADDVVFMHIVVIENWVEVERQYWPDIQHRLHVCFGLAFQVQIEIARECEDNTSPSSAYMHKLMPRPCAHTVIMETCPTIGIEYTQEHIVGKHVNWRMG